MTSRIPDMQNGKPAGVRCIQLTEDHRCRLYGQPERPSACAQFRAEPEVCGTSFGEAMSLLVRWEAESS